jgi:8-oxo-dGTP pyrophosphatase MutT (NUDIX family)
VLDPDGRVLLVAASTARVHAPGAPPLPAPVWFVPGGGVTSSEDLQQAAAREVFEETGVRPSRWGPVVWRRRSDLVIDGRPVCQDEHYLLAYTDVVALEPEAAGGGRTAFERDAGLAARWWHPDALAATPGSLVPPALPRLVADLLRGEVPAAPIDISDPA